MSPVKEPHFFALEGESVTFVGPRDKEILDHIAVTEIEPYRDLFSGVSNETAVGEASAVYLYSSKAPKRIRRHLDEVKLIAVLRHPAERAYSSYLHMVRDGREPLDDFGQALREEKARTQNNWAPIWHYKRAGFYSGQLARYFEEFDRQQIRIYLYEDLKDASADKLKDILQFVEVDDTFVPDMSGRYNVAGIPKNRSLHAVHQFLIKPHPVKSVLKPIVPKNLRRGAIERLVNGIRNQNLVKPPFPTEVREQLVEDYREDIQKLEDLIQRDLSGWLR
ncbi:sulfotransferase [soil metagenome]